MLLFIINCSQDDAQSNDRERIAAVFELLTITHTKTTTVDMLEG